MALIIVIALWIGSIVLFSAYVCKRLNSIDEKNKAYDYRCRLINMFYTIKIPFLEDKTDLINYLTENKIGCLIFSEYGNDVIEIVSIDSEKYTEMKELGYNLMGTSETKVKANEALISYLDENNICYYSDKDSFIRGESWQAAKSLNTENLKRLANYFKENDINGYFTLKQAKKIYGEPTDTEDVEFDITAIGCPVEIPSLIE